MTLYIICLLNIYKRKYIYQLAGLPDRTKYEGKLPLSSTTSTALSSSNRSGFHKKAHIFLAQKHDCVKLTGKQQETNKCIYDEPTLLISLTSRLQYVRLNGLLSSAIRTDTGVPQGTVLAPFLFALYTADCRSTDQSCPLVKFADDTELVGKINNDEDKIYHKQIETLRIGVIKITCI